MNRRLRAYLQTARKIGARFVPGGAHTACDAAPLWLAVERSDVPRRHAPRPPAAAASFRSPAVHPHSLQSRKNNHSTESVRRKAAADAGQTPRKPPAGSGPGLRPHNLSTNSGLKCAKKTSYASFVQSEYKRYKLLVKYPRITCHHQHLYSG